MSNRQQKRAVLAAPAFWGVLSVVFVLVFTWPFFDFVVTRTIGATYRLLIGAWLALIVLLALTSTQVGKDGTDV